MIAHVTAIADHHIPPAVREAWLHFRAGHVQARNIQVRLIHDLVALFGARGARVMLLKGAALDLTVYGEPWYTESSDADLLIDRGWNEFSSGDREVLSGINEQPGLEIGFLRHHDLDMNRVLRIDYHAVWNRARAVDLPSGRAYVMSPEDMMLTACTSLCRRRYRLLKDMMAVREIMAANPALDWDALAAHAHAAGADRIVFTALAAVRRVFDEEIPAGVMNNFGLTGVRRSIVHALSAAVTSRMFAAPGIARQTGAARLTQEVLRLSSYHAWQLWPEVQGQLAYRQFRATQRSTPRVMKSSGPV